MPGFGKRRRHAKRKHENQRIAQGRIAYLVGLYEGPCADGDMELSRRAGTMAYRLSTKYKLTIPRVIKHRHCRRCKVLGLPSETRVRIRSGRRILTCAGCGEVRRLPFKPVTAGEPPEPYPKKVDDGGPS